MKSMGISELRAHLSEALRDVERGEAIEITRRGDAVALLVPVRQHSNEEQIRTALTSLGELAAEISRFVPGPTNVTKHISETRR